MKHRRTVKLVLPALQVRLIVAFLGLAALALALQYILLMSVMASLATELPHDGLLLIDGLGPLLLRIFAISAGLILPLTFLVGVLATHRFAGPIYRMQVFLRDVIAGKRPRDCKLRQGDELQDFCALLNQATAAVRGQPEPAASGDGPVDPPSALPSRPAAESPQQSPLAQG